MTEAQAIDLFVEKQKQLHGEISKVIIGQQEVVELLINAIFSKGHALLVGVPGLAKTLLIHTVADALGLSFNRIQFTPDLMPSDIVGSEILGENREFRFIKG
ncbi:MAG: AAA domain-containing protein, partial [Flavobacteriales bacterium]|nr:AAA domain-containing protein [Flavobacteriales bacterium]